MDPKIIYGFLCFLAGHTFAWFQLNSQFVWEWWKDKPVLSVALFAFPVGYCFWNGARLIFGATEELWTARFFAFSASYVSFPLLTWYFLGESFFTPKTVTCTLLAMCILGIQIWWR